MESHLHGLARDVVYDVIGRSRLPSVVAVGKMAREEGQWPRVESTATAVYYHLITSTTHFSSSQQIVIPRHILSLSLNR
jgi:hypothetical protein